MSNAGIAITSRAPTATTMRTIAAFDRARPGDLVLIAGKGHEQGQEFADGHKIPFDDREVAREELEKLRASATPDTWEAGA